MIRAWQPRPEPLELIRCQARYAKTFKVDTLPAQNTSDTAGLFVFVAGFVGALFEFGCWKYPVTMRTVPISYTTYNPNNTNAQIRDRSNNVDGSNTAVDFNSESTARVSCTGNVSTTAGSIMAVHIAADADL